MKLLSLLTAASLAPLAATVPPYVQAGTPTSMTVIWAGPLAAATLVVSDAAGREVKTLHDGAGRRHVFKVDGLAPGTHYQYKALLGATGVGQGTFHTNNGPDQTKFRFIVVGDSGSGNANQYAVAKQMLAWKPDFVLHTGDVVYEDGSASDYQPNFVAPYKAMIANTVIYPTLGNHDYRTQQGGPYISFFELPRETSQTTERWYTFTYGDVQFFGLDSNAKAGPGSAQYTWLEQRLAASTARWKMAYFHHPLYSSGWEGSSLGLRAVWGPLFTKHHVQVVFNGHDHDYERIKPQGGVQYVVTGGGGAWLRDMKVSDFTAFERKKVYHFVGVEMDGERLTASAIDSHGEAFDRWTVQR